MADVGQRHCQQLRVKQKKINHMSLLIMKIDVSRSTKNVDMNKGDQFLAVLRT